MFTARVHDLMHQKHDIQYKLAKITKRIRDLQQYASLVGNGSISIGELLSAPGTMMGRTMNYLNYAHNSSMAYMQQNAPFMMQMYSQQLAAAGQQNPQQQAMMQNYIMRSLYTQAREQAKQVEEKNLNAEEERLQQEKEKLQTLHDEVAAELKAAREGRDAEIKEMAPKYTANA